MEKILVEEENLKLRFGESQRSSYDVSFHFASCEKKNGYIEIFRLKSCQFSSERLYEIIRLEKKLILTHISISFTTHRERGKEWSGWVEMCSICM